MDDFELEIKKEFLLEAKELLSGTEKCFLSLERMPSDPETINSIFRLAHNLKGSAGAVGFSDLAEFTHKLESVLLALKNGRLNASNKLVDMLLRANDYLVRTVDTLQRDPNASYANANLSQELVAVLNSEAEEKPSEEILECEKLSATVPVEEQKMPISTGNSTHAKSRDENIRVSLARIEKLLNNVGELSILQAVMAQQGMGLGNKMPNLMRETLSSMTKIIKETQSLSMSLRMLPIKQCFQKMERIVRDTSKALGKKVDLHLSGEETEIDKTVLEQLADPLVHIIRNAVDHGLEDSESRKAKGKAETGQVYLSAFHRAGQIVIEVRDDGKGLDAHALVAKAKSKRIIPDDAELTAEQAYDLIFAPGFSTKDVVSDVSGRGVGMDVVRTNIASLQGNVEIETRLGEGTCFRILLPLTLAIIDSIIVRSGEERYVVPLCQVNEFFCPKQEDMSHDEGHSELMTLRDETFSAYKLTSLIGNAYSKRRDAWTQTALIVGEARHSRFAVMVDKIVAQQQVVIKPAGDEMRGKSGLTGFAILGDGKPALILDLLELAKTMRAKDHSRNEFNRTPRQEAA